MADDRGNQKSKIYPYSASCDLSGSGFRHGAPPVCFPAILTFFQATKRPVWASPPCEDFQAILSDPDQPDGGARSIRSMLYSCFVLRRRYEPFIAEYAAKANFTTYRPTVREP